MTYASVPLTNSPSQRNGPLYETTQASRTETDNISYPDVYTEAYTYNIGTQPSAPPMPNDMPYPESLGRYPQTATGIPVQPNPSMDTPPAPSTNYFPEATGYQPWQQPIPWIPNQTVDDLKRKITDFNGYVDLARADLNKQAKQNTTFLQQRLRLDGKILSGVAFGWFVFALNPSFPFAIAACTLASGSAYLFEKILDNRRLNSQIKKLYAFEYEAIKDLYNNLINRSSNTSLDCRTNYAIHSLAKQCRTLLSNVHIGTKSLPKMQTSANNTGSFPFFQAPYPVYINTPYQNPFHFFAKPCNRSFFSARESQGARQNDRNEPNKTDAQVKKDYAKVALLGATAVTGLLSGILYRSRYQAAPMEKSFDDHTTILPSAPMLMGVNRSTRPTYTHI